MFIHEYEYTYIESKTKYELGPGGIAQLIKHLPQKCEDLSLNAQKPPCKLILLDKVPGQLETAASNKMRNVPEDLYPSLSSDSEMPPAQIYIKLHTKIKHQSWVSLIPAF